MAGNTDARLCPSEAKPGDRRADRYRANKLAAGCLEKVAWADARSGKGSIFYWGIFRDGGIAGVAKTMDPCFP